MDKIDVLQKEYSELKIQYLVTKSLNDREDLKNKLMELDYELNKQYEEDLTNKFPMTTTLDKEAVRLEQLISFVKSKQEKQNKLIEDYKKLTTQTIELSHIKYSDKLLEYNKRLDLVKKFLTIKKDLTKLLDNQKDVNNPKVKVLKNKLMKKEMLNLLYEFCLIDSLDVKDIDIEKVIKEEKDEKENTTKESGLKLQDIIESDRDKKEVKEDVKLEKKQEIKVDVIPEVKEEKEEEKILTSMPKIDKLGTVTPVNIFETIKKTEEKLPDVVIPSNGLTKESEEIFIDTKNYFN